ncbi:MAG: IS110 family transposase [Planctomycetota bacterium]|jgi:transposase
MNNSLAAFDPCGIEVSSGILVVALRRQDRDEPLREFPNTPAGHQAVLRFLERSARPVRVCMESTGLYGLDLALALHQADVAVMVANPRAVRHFAQALLQRSKNDQLDATVLCEFAARMPFQAWRAPSAAALQLVAVARRLEALTDLMAAEKNRRHAASLSAALPALVRRDIERSIQTQQRAIDRLTRAAQEFILADAELARRYELLLSIPGFGATSAVHTLAELTLLPAGMGVRQWVASAGLDPREYTSGTSVHKKVRISKAGNKHLRRGLYMPALVAVRHDPHVRAYYEHLLARGKIKMQALVATMRKLLHAIYGMFKHDQLFDGAKVYASSAAVLAPALSNSEVA